MTKNILFITRSSEEGGEAVFINKIKELLKQDYSIKTCSLLGDNKLKQVDKVFLQPNVLFNKPVIIFKSLRILMQEMKKADTVEHFVFGIYSIIFFFVGQFYKKNTIVTFHTNLNSGGVIRYPYNIVLKFFIVNYFIIFTDKAVFITDFQLQEFRKFCILKRAFDSKSSFIHNFIERKYILQKEKKFGKNIRVIFVGRLTKAKGFDVFGKVANFFKNNANISFMAIGSQIDKSIEVPANVSVIDHVDNEQVFKYYDESDILLFPSRDETFGMVILEAMARGLLILTTNLDTVKEYFIDRENGFMFSVGNINEITTILNNIITDQSILVHMSKYNCTRAAKFNEDQARTDLFNLYDL